MPQRGDRKWIDQDFVDHDAQGNESSNEKVDARIDRERLVSDSMEKDGACKDDRHEKGGNHLGVVVIVVVVAVV